MITSRRSFLSLLAAPAIVRAGSIMPVSVFQDAFWTLGFEQRMPLSSLLTTYIDPRIYEILFRTDDDALDLGWPQRRQLSLDV